MKIDPLSSLRTSLVRRKDRAKGASAGGFASELAAESGESQSVSGGGSVAPMDSLLALQEVDNEQADRDGARRHGEALLAQLDELRYALLAGALPLCRLERLVQTLKSRRGTILDPRLAEVVAEIELRAAVELAKLGR